jgi:UDP-N-acetylglucosamine--N-acetylmuramyl-(pentapeptide) pyrophosphoryl-undecaprenol N-acetylglucosamine transferase
MVRQAAREGVATALLNPDAVPGKANRYLARHSRAIFTQFESTADCFSPAVRANVQCVGCPVRPSLGGADAADARRAFALGDDRRTLLVSGGSTLAHSLTEAVCALADELESFAENWQILIAAGQKRDEALTAFAGRSINVRVEPYLQRMDLAYAAADLAVTRGGAGTIAELRETGTPAIILPYPHHADQQQLRNAKGMVEGGGAIVVDDVGNPASNAASLGEQLFPLLRDPQRLATMQRGAGLGSRRDAAGAVAEWLLQQ